MESKQRAGATQAANKGGVRALPGGFWNSARLVGMHTRARQPFSQGRRWLTGRGSACT